MIFKLPKAADELSDKWLGDLMNSREIASHQQRMALILDLKDEGRKTLFKEELYEYQLLGRFLHHLSDWGPSLSNIDMTSSERSTCLLLSLLYNVILKHNHQKESWSSCYWNWLTNKVTNWGGAWWTLGKSHDIKGIFSPCIRLKDEGRKNPLGENFLKVGFSEDFTIAPLMEERFRQRLTWQPHKGQICQLLPPSHQGWKEILMKEEESDFSHFLLESIIVYLFPSGQRMEKIHAGWLAKGGEASESITCNYVSTN